MLPMFPEWTAVSGLQSLKNGARRSIVDEPLTLTKSYQVEWCVPKVNLRELALLRFMHGKSEQELAKFFGRSKTAIHGLLERMIKNDFMNANLTTAERKQIKWKS
jgi:hypothetical protein